MAIIKNSYVHYEPTHPGRAIANVQQHQFDLGPHEGVMAGFPANFPGLIDHGFIQMGLGRGFYGMERANSSTVLEINQFLITSALTLVWDDYGLLLTPAAANPSIVTVRSNPSFPAGFHAANPGVKTRHIARAMFRCNTSFPNIALGFGTAAASGVHAADPADSIMIRTDLTGTDKFVGTVQAASAGAALVDLGNMGTTFGAGVIHDIGMNFTLSSVAADCNGHFYYNQITAAGETQTVTRFTTAQLAELVSVNDQLDTYFEIGRVDSAQHTVNIGTAFAYSSLR